MKQLTSHELANLLLKYKNMPVFTSSEDGEDLILSEVSCLDFSIGDIVMIGNNHVSMTHQEFAEKKASDCDVLIVDVDGVFLDWGSRVGNFAKENGIDVDLSVLENEKFCTPQQLFIGTTESEAEELVLQYHRSMHLRHLVPYNDALEFVARLKHNYQLVAVTAIGTDPQVVANRVYNLQNIFHYAFSEIICCDPLGTKLQSFIDIKEKYGDRVVGYVDDLTHHLIDCKKVFDIPCYRILRGDNMPSDDDTEFNMIEELTEINLL